jgi:hypothetical protein
MKSIEFASEPSRFVRDRESRNARRTAAIDMICRSTFRGSKRKRPGSNCRPVTWIAFRFTLKAKRGRRPDLVHFVERYALSVAKCY